MDIGSQPPGRSVRRFRRIWRRGLVSILILQLAVPLPAMSAIASLGTARGSRGVELSLDSGKTWFPLAANALPVVDDTYLRSSTGNAVLDLTYGSRINLLPFTAVSLKEAGRAIELTLHYGRLTFALPLKTRVVILSRVARLDPVPSEVMAGEVVLDGKGMLGLKMSRGQLQVTDLSDRRQVRLASLEPVFLPKRPPADVSFLSSSSSAEAPANARPVFNPGGQSLGYLRPDGQLVVQPGFTSNLSRAFPPKVVQAAMAKVAPEDRQTATPFFDLSGSYVGYVSGPVFYAQVKPAPVQPIRMAQAVVGGPQGPPREARREGCWVPLPPPGAKDVFDPSGRNIGYLTPNPGLVLHEGPPGSPFPPEVVQGVLGQYPTNATPLFDSNGTYIGYLSGDFFYPAGSLEGGAVRRPIHCGYFVLGALGFVGAGTGLYFLVREADIGFHEKEATTNQTGQPQQK